MRLLQEMARQVERFDARAFLACLDVSDSANWFLEYWESGNYLGKDLPSVVPPFASCWMEYCHKGTRAGTWVWAYRLQEDNPDWFRDVEAAILKRVHGIGYGTPLDLRRLFTLAWFRGPVEWIVTHEVCYLTAKKLHAAGYSIVFGDSYGKIIDHIYISAIEDEFYTTLLEPFLFALSLLHCKNVALEDLPGPPPAVAKKRAKKGIPEIKFKTLVIEPMRQQIKREKAQDGELTSEIQRALHLCRGNFKDYREGGGLFGKFHDVYWFGPHVRGSLRQGAVIKDYKVKPPRDSQ